MEPAALLKLDALTLFLYFVVPGFIALKTYDLLVPSEPRDFGKSIIEIIAFSMFNWALLFWLVTPGGLAFQQQHPRWYVLVSYLLVFVAPVLLAYAGYLVRRSRLAFLPRWTRVRLTDVHPTAWDYFFDRPQPCFMLFHLKSGEVLGAAYSNRSFTTAFPHPPTIYVEQLWVVDPQTKAFLGKIEQSIGAYIRMEDCLYIEMYAEKEEPHGPADPGGPANPGGGGPGSGQHP